MDLGIGRGDSAQRVLGRTPVTARTLDRAVGVIRDLVEGRTTTYLDAELDLTWTPGWKLPVWIAGYGPLVLGMTGRVADGVILQLADVDLIRWMAGMVREAAVEAGRDPDSHQGPGRGPRACRSHRGVPRARALVPGPRQQPRRRSGQQVPARAAAGVADRATSRTARATTTGTTPRSARTTRSS